MPLTETITAYTIEEHPNPEAVFDWLRNNWHDLGEHCVHEAVDSLKAFCTFFQADLSEYSVGIFSDRSENWVIDIHADLEKLHGVRLWKYINNNFVAQHPDLLSGNCPFTGVCYDDSLMDEMAAFITRPDNRDWKSLLNDCIAALYTSLHNEGEYIYSDEGLRETCEANEYYFTENGVFHS